MGVAYFFAGFWKLATVGTAWFTSDSLSHLAAKLAYAGIGSRVGGLERVEGRLSRWQTLCAFVWANHPPMRDARDVRFLLDDLDLSSGPDAPRRLGERALFACQHP
jgi:hypothetical protein